MFIRRLYFWSLLVLCFLFGAVSATFYETMTSKQERRSRRVRTSDIVKQIDMSDQQRALLNAVLENGRERMVALSKSIRPEFTKIRQETRAEMREILTEQQRNEFDKLLEAHDKSRKSSSSNASKKD